MSDDMVVKTNAVSRQKTLNFKSILSRAVSLPGKLLGFSVLFVMLAEILIFIPSAANFRTEWLMDRVDAAYLAALAAESAGEDGLSENRVREILSGAGVLAVGRIYKDTNELVLSSDLGGHSIIHANLVSENTLDRITALKDTFFAPDGRYIRTIAHPSARNDELISIIVPENELKSELLEYSTNVTILSLLIALFTGTLIYICLLFILVTPMRRLANAMTTFQNNPTDTTRAFKASNRSDEIGQAERALAAMEAEVRTAFVQRERLAALGGAVARINHDLRNVLASAQLVSDQLAMNSDQRIVKMGSRLLRAVDRGVKLCQETLEYGKAKEKAPEIKPVHLKNALEDAANDAFQTNGAAEWINDVNENIYTNADPDHLHRIIVNLVQNSVQATSDKRGYIIARSKPEGGYVIVSLIDNGSGIPSQIQKTLFQPFGQTGKSNGTGLGLSISRELARAMGGDVSLSQTDSNGTQFDIRLLRST